MEQREHPPTAESRLSRVERSRALPLWTQDASERVVELEGRLIHVEDENRQAEVRALIEASIELVVSRVPRWHLRRRFSDWWNGTRVERTWAYLHEAELRLVEHANARGLAMELDDAILRAERLDPEDPARDRLAQFIKARASNGDSIARPSGGPRHVE